VSTVVIADATLGLGSALEAIFEPHGGIETVIPRDGGTVYVKPNGVHFAPHTFTDPAVLEAVLAYLRDHGYTRLAVMESSTGGNFTRLVFRVTGYGELCRRYGAEPVYLDEGPTVEVSLRDGTRARIARRLNDEILHRQDGPLTNGAGTPRAGNHSSATGRSFYLSLPKLKTHSMATVTLGVKNQQAFPVDADRMVHHNHETLHLRLAALYALTRPDFCIIEGLTATAHGHFPATALLDECLVPMDVLVGGQDTLAVDVIGARVLGYALDEVEHLRLCAEWGLGEGDIERVSRRAFPTPCCGDSTRKYAGLSVAPRRVSKGAGAIRNASRRCSTMIITARAGGPSSVALAFRTAILTACRATSWSLARALATRSVNPCADATLTGRYSWYLSTMI